MNRLTRQIARMMRPTAALIAYAEEDEYRQKDYYLEFRKIGNDGTMESGKPVSVKFVQSLAESFTVESSSVPYGEIPKGLFFVNTRESNYVWHTPSCRKYLYFKNGLNIPNGEYCIPGLIWQVKGESLYMFAYRAKRLTSGTQLYSAPFFNVNPSSGSVCLGNAKLKLPEKLTFQMFIKYWEEKFFLSEFSHVSGSNPTKNNLVLVTLNSKQAFDGAELIPVKKLKLKNLLK
jgi:PRTRC genetic system protein B